MLRIHTESSNGTDTGAKRAILVADDDRSFRSELSGYLRDQGFRVIEAEDGLEALDAIERFCPYLILLDIRMPGVDGLRVVHYAGSRLPDAKVVAMSGHIDEIHRAHLLSAGAFWVVEKPLPMGILAKFARDLYFIPLPVPGHV